MKKLLVILCLLFLMASCSFFQSESKQNILLFENTDVNELLQKERFLGADVIFRRGTPSKYICPEFISAA